MMTRSPEAPFLVACAVAVLACGSDRGLGPEPAPEPDPVVPDPAPTPVLAVLSLRPSEHLLSQGWTQRLYVSATSQQGRSIDVLPSIAFESDAPEVASVDARGIVTALTPGTSTISVTASSGGSTRSASMRLHVVDTLPRDTLHLTMGELGWQPLPGYLAVGGVVRWEVPIGWRAPGAMIFLWRFSGLFFSDTVEVIGGYATRTFVSPDTINYCLGCEFSHQYGSVFVRRR